MSTSLARINHTLEFLESFKLRLTSDSHINDLKILRQTPAVAVIGLVSRGKSTLVNKLIGIDLLPTGPNPVTFGNGFLSTGRPKAIGRDKKGRPVELPTSADEFRHRARRHDAQDIIDFEYSGILRIPKNVMLIDTKGLDEVSTNFNDDLIELERSWASQGAMAAIMVTSVPPGMSKQDAMLFRSLKDHFRGNVIVVVKQTDSSLSKEDVEEASSVWSGHGAEVLHISDLRPLNEDGWGSGPLAELESRISRFWSLADNFKDDAIQRLEEAITQLAEALKAPSHRTSNRDEKLELLWTALDDTKLMPSVRNTVRARLCEFYSKSYSVPTDRDELDLTLKYAAIGSTDSIQHLNNALRENSRLRSTYQLGVLIEIIRTKIPKNLDQILQNVNLKNDEEFVAISRLVDQIYDSGGDWTHVIGLCHRYSSQIRQEQKILQLMKSGGNLTSTKLLSDLFSIWKFHLHNTQSQCAGNSFATSVLKTNESNFRSISSDVERNVRLILSDVEILSDDWGKNEFNQYQQKRRSFLRFHRSEPGNSHSLKQLTVRGDHISQVLVRIACLAPITSPETQRSINEFLILIGENSKRQVWARRSLEIESHVEEFALSYTSAYGWLASGSAVLCFLTLANKAFPLSMFLGALTLLFWANWFFSQDSDPIRIKPFSENDELKPLDEQLRNKFIVFGVAISVIGLTAMTISTFMPDETNSRDTDRSSSNASFQPTEITTSTSSTTTTSIPNEFISSDDLIEDQIQDGRGSEVAAISLPSDISDRIGYAFRITDRWSYLPSQLSVRYCWVNQDGFDFWCESTTAIRFSHVTDAVIYSVNTKIDDSTPAGQYRVKIEISEVVGSFISTKTIDVIQEITPTTSSTLPYLTTRNRYWNADCPRVMTKNEFLPLKICQEGRGVRYVQSLLGINADGYFGNTTHNALLDFQYSKGLPTTGIVDSRTWLELDPNQKGPGTDLNGDGLITPDEFG